MIPQTVGLFIYVMHSMISQTVGLFI